MKKFFLPLMLMIFLLTGCGRDSDLKETLIIGVDDEFAPFAFHNERNELVGFDIDLAKEAARRMGVKAEFKSIDWDNKESEITSGNIDMIWNGLDILDEYKGYMIFSKPYMDNRQIIMIRKRDAHKINSEGDLAGKVVGTQAGSNAETYINEHPDIKRHFADFKTYRNIKAEFTALENGMVDALIIDEIAGRYEMLKRPDVFKSFEVTVGAVTEFGIGFRKKDTALRDKVQAAFDSMTADGTAQKISKQWFHADLIKSRK